jgi:hypothetical protein
VSLWIANTPAPGAAQRVSKGAFTPLALKRAIAHWFAVTSAKSPAQKAAHLASRSAGTSVSIHNARRTVESRAHRVRYSHCFVCLILFTKTEPSAYLKLLFDVDVSGKV